MSYWQFQQFLALFRLFGLFFLTYWLFFGLLALSGLISPSFWSLQFSAKYIRQIKFFSNSKYNNTLKSLKKKKVNTREAHSIDWLKCWQSSFYPAHYTQFGHRLPQKNLVNAVVCCTGQSKSLATNTFPFFLIKKLFFF